MDVIDRLEETARSEEVEDIVERMPTRTGYWVLFLLFTILGIGVGLCWWIQYPNIVEGEIVINSLHPPVRLVANANGQLELFVKPRQLVTEGELLAVIRNLASVADIQSLKELLKQFYESQDGWDVASIHFPQHLTLGEIEMKYTAFWDACNEMEKDLRDNRYEKQLLDMKTLVKEQQNVLTP